MRTRIPSRVSLCFAALILCVGMALLPRLSDQRAVAAADAGQSPTSLRVGTCDLVDIANDMLLVGQDAAEREVAEKEFSAALEGLQREVKRSQQAILAAQGQAPESMHINLAHLKLDLMHQEAAVTQKRERLAKRQFAVAYVKVRQTAKAVSGEQGITLLLQSSDDDALPMADADNAWFVSDVLGRVAVVADGVPDLTAAVRERLGMKAEKPDQSTPGTEKGEGTSAK